MSAGPASKGGDVEAVIISGERKGDLVRIDLDALSAQPEVEAAVEKLIDVAKEISANLAASTAEAKALREERIRGGIAATGGCGAGWR